MERIKKNQLYLVTERMEADNCEVNSLYTAEDLFGAGGFFSDMDLESAGELDWPYLVYRESKPTAQEWRLHEVDMDSSMEQASHEIAQFLSGTYNTTDCSWENDSMRVTPGARKLLAQLMQPVLSADFGGGKWMHTQADNEWANAHPDFVNDLDKVYSSLDLIRVNRVRTSVTQGEVSVVCNGIEAVRYGDDMWLQQKDGSIHNAMSGRTQPGPLYGPVIGGWGSAIPDDEFRKAAIVQYASMIYECLQQQPCREVEVWQLNDSPESRNARFLSFDKNIQLNGSFKPELYNQVWTGSVTANTLEDIFYIFNMAHPEDYKSPSLSVSDVVKVDGGYYFCDSLGFRKISFERKNPSLDERLESAKSASEDIVIDKRSKDIRGPEERR